MPEVTSEFVPLYVMFAACVLLIVGNEIRRKWHYRGFERRRKATNHGWGQWRWSQDGWVRNCKLCRLTQYGGDDYNGGPNENGPFG